MLGGSSTNKGCYPGTVTTLLQTLWQHRPASKCLPNHLAVAYSKVSLSKGSTSCLNKKMERFLLRRYYCSSLATFPWLCLLHVFLGWRTWQPSMVATNQHWNLQWYTVAFEKLPEVCSRYKL